jgi:2-methylisocitrate lyase-like PEP mutase family enzyme
MSTCRSFERRSQQDRIPASSSSPARIRWRCTVWTRRCKAFAAAGADAVFVDAPHTVDDLKTIASAMRDSGVPLVFNSARTGRSPVLDEGCLADLGYPIVLYPLEAMLIAQHAVRENVRAMMHARTTEQVSDRMLMFNEVNSLVGLQEALKRSSGASN